MLPIALFTVLLIVRDSLGASASSSESHSLSLSPSSLPWWSLWAVCSPLFVACLGLLLVTSVSRFDSPFVARLAWGYGLACATTFCVLVVARVDLSDRIPALSHPWVPFVPHWSLALGFAVIGLYSFWPSSATRNCAAGVLLVVSGCLWGLLSILAYLRVTGNDSPSLTWYGVLAPWWVLDGLLLVVGIVMLLFSFGARQSALFTIGQQLLFLVIVLASAALKVLVAASLEGGKVAVTEATVLATALFVEAMIALLGVLFAVGRNRDTVVCGRYAGRTLPRTSARRRTVNVASTSATGSLNV
jgi:hypothetical protein